MRSCLNCLLLLHLITGCSHLEVWESNIAYPHTPLPARDRVEERLSMLYRTACRVSTKDGGEAFSINGKFVSLFVPTIGQKDCKLGIPYAVCEADGSARTPKELCKRVE